MQDSDSSRRFMARLLTYGFWLALLAGMTVYFGGVLDKRNNPNQHLATQNGPAGEVVLKRNAYGHYVAPGLINNTPVVFMLDTGATSISIPKTVADRMHLNPRGSSQVSTANGSITVYNVRLDSVSLGSITLNDMRAHINPYMEGETVLLGMSFMQHLEMIQKGDTLRLRL
ncbi:TIGR02281 family clan AA aspartic protease [Pontibacterium granulatum]|uniref:retropepsin-like aspartic protease family protein n=1 Tax=Pontibacterium granulatum TaxID=2036029 RepID=UPI00249AE36F|nr:TIGR02281 family clan AA aspartic protease [Pontibacterium granulatum]MDI3326831.1 TIGR02281 family clan AA aspartic protease [Pontibacterium granulatum]